LTETDSAPLEKVIFVLNKEVIFSGEPKLTYTPAEDTYSDVRAEIAAKTILSLVTIDLSAPGEVRFKSENTTLDTLRQIDDLHHIIIEVEDDVLDNWVGPMEEETP